MDLRQVAERNGMKVTQIVRSQPTLENAFVGQLRNYGRPGDIALSLSVSGNSPNWIRGLQYLARLQASKRNYTESVESI